MEKNRNFFCLMRHDIQMYITLIKLAIYVWVYMLYRHRSMQTHAYMHIHVATCRDVLRLHLLKTHPLSLLYTCIMK